MADITRLKQIVKIAADLAESIKAAKEDDGKIDLQEAAGFVVQLIPLIEVIQSKDELVEEIKDIDAAEVDELVSYAKTELDLGGSKAELIVEGVLDALNVLFDLLQIFAPDEEEDLEEE